MWRQDGFHSGEGGCADDGVVCGWAVDYQEVSVDESPSRAEADGEGKLDAPDWLDHIVREV
ncbi:unnamed protein product [Prunus armeniaca]